MAKKRKVHPTTELESATIQEPEQPQEQEEPQFEAEPQQEEQIEEEDPQEMEEEDEDGNEEDDDGDEKPEPQEGETVKSDVAALNGVSNEAAENGGDDEVELEDEPVEKLLEPFVKEQLVLLVKEAVTKYPELMENVLKLADADPAHRKIFVHGLGWDTNTETLAGIFSKYGEIEDCKAVCDKSTGKCKGYGFVLYKHRNGARKALKEPQKKVGSRLASCQLASAGPSPAQAPVPAPAAPVIAAAPVSEYTQRKIFVSNVSADIDIQRLIEFFSQFGEIEDGPLGLDKQTGKPRGFCLFVYKSIESAKKALEEPHKNFEGVTLHCQKAVDGPKHNKVFNQQPHQQQQYPAHSIRKDKNKYGGAGSASGHLMAPGGAGMGFNPAVAAPGLNPALGQALALLTQGAGLGINNLLGGLGAPVNQGGPPMMSNQGYGNQPGGGYGNQMSGGYVNPPGMQGGYQNPQMGHGAGRQPGGAPYMGHGH